MTQPSQPSCSCTSTVLLACAVLLVELINTAAGLCSLLLTGIERMALGTDFHVDLFLCTAGNESVTAVAGYGCLIVLRMYSFSHLLLLLPASQTHKGISANVCGTLLG